MLRILLLAIGVVVAVSLLPIQSTQPSAFADPAFVRYFQRTGAQGRALLWGAGPIVSLVEPFTGAPGNRRLVEYFERGRMELATEDPEAPGRVTTGLLVREMATGNVQVGYEDFVQGDPAPLPIFGGASGDPAGRVTYADFAADARDRAGDRPGDAVVAWMTPGGVAEHAAPERVTLGRYDAQTGHNVPGIVDDWLAGAPLGALTPLEALGHPISEPYWVESGKGPAGVSLVQLFERRVLVYTPGLPEGERFTLTSSGRHYYQWRYANDPAPGVPAATRRESIAGFLPVGEPVGLTVPDGYSAARVDIDVSGVVDIAVGPAGRVALLRSAGQVDVYDPRAGAPAGAPFVEHLPNPVALAWSGTSLYVADDRGVFRYADRDADGRPEIAEPVAAGGMSRASVALGAGADGGVAVAGFPAARTATPEAAAGRPLRVVNERGVVLHAATLASPAGPLLVAPDGVVWFVDADRYLASLDPATGAVAVRMDLATLGADATVVGLLLYRADGTAGTVANDLLAVVRDGDSGGRLVRLMPAERPARATPAVGTPPPSGAVVEFASGLDRPRQASAGLDGSLYILDTAREALYLIHPTR